MPIYEYECLEKHITFRVKSIKSTDEERENDVCETCKAPAVQILSKPGRPILVGSGFHENDYQHGKLGS